MYQLEKLIDYSWRPQCKHEEFDVIRHELEDYAENYIKVFKTCDAVRIVDLNSGETVLQYP